MPPRIGVRVSGALMTFPSTLRWPGGCVSDLLVRHAGRVQGVLVAAAVAGDDLRGRVVVVGGGGVADLALPGAGVARPAGQLVEQRERVLVDQPRVAAGRTGGGLVEEDLAEVEGAGHGDVPQLGLVGCWPGDNHVRANDGDFDVRQMQKCGAVAESLSGGAPRLRRGRRGRRQDDRDEPDRRRWGGRAWCRGVRERHGEGEGDRGGDGRGRGGQCAGAPSPAPRAGPPGSAAPTRRACRAGGPAARPVVRAGPDRRPADRRARHPGLRSQRPAALTVALTVSSWR
jgi:hypothetical protein